MVDESGAVGSCESTTAATQLASSMLATSSSSACPCLCKSRSMGWRLCLLLQATALLLLACIQTTEAYARGHENDECVIENDNICAVADNADLIFTGQAVKFGAYGYYKKCMALVTIDCYWSQNQYLTPVPQAGTNITVAGYYYMDPEFSTTSTTETETWWFNEWQGCNVSKVDCDQRIEGNTTYLWALSRNTWNDEFEFYPTVDSYGMNMIQYDDLTGDMLAKNEHTYMLPPTTTSSESTTVDEFDWSLDYQECRACAFLECAHFTDGYRDDDDPGCAYDCPMAANHTQYKHTLSFCNDGIRYPTNTPLWIIIVATIGAFLFVGMCIGAMLYRNKRVLAQKRAMGVYVPNDVASQDPNSPKSAMSSMSNEEMQAAGDKAYREKRRKEEERAAQGVGGGLATSTAAGAGPTRRTSRAGSRSGEAEMTKKGSKSSMKGGTGSGSVNLATANSTPNPAAGFDAPTQWRLPEKVEDELA